MNKEKSSGISIKTILLEKTLRVAAPVLFLIMTIGIYFPSVLFLGNINEFPISYRKAIPYFLLVCAFILVVLYLLSLLCIHEKVFRIYIALLFAVTLGFYIQGNFLNFGLTSLNGSKIDWAQHKTGMIVSIIAWLVCLAGSVILMCKKQKAAETVIKWGSLLLSAMQLVSLVVMILTTHRTTENDFAVTKKDEFQLSSNQNTIMFVVDTLDASWFEDTILDSNEYSGKLKDFTFYNDAVGGGAPTSIGIPTLLTGRLYQNPSMSVDEYYKDAYGKSSVFQNLVDHGYLVKLYTDYSLLNYSDIHNVDNVKTGCEYKVAWKSEFIKYIYRFTSFYAMPMPLKQMFWFYSDECSNMFAIDDDTDIYNFNDPLFFEEYKNNGITTQSDKNAFVMYHLTGVHSPFTIDENALKSEKETTLEQQVNGLFKIITEYIEELKEKGLYDNSTIIITADHGGVELYQNPAVLVKEEDAKGDKITVSDAPVTFQNLIATYMKAAMNDYDSSADGKQLYGATLTEIQNRSEKAGSNGTSDENSGNNSDNNSDNDLDYSEIIRYHAAPDTLGVDAFPDVDYVARQEWTLYRINGNARDLNKMEPLEFGKYNLPND